MSDAICEVGTELLDLRAQRAVPVFPGPTASRELPEMTARPVLQAPQEQMALPERRARTDVAEAQGPQVLKGRRARPERLALRELEATKADPGTKLIRGRHTYLGQPFGWPLMMGPL